MSKNLTINIKTDRLILRNVNLDDVSQDYADWLNDSEINKYLSCANTQQTKESCVLYVQSFAGRKDKALIGIFLKNDGLHIGNITFSTIDWHNKSGTVGISLGRKAFMGKGLAKETLISVVKYCFERLSLHRIQAGINTENIRSLNLFVKCGFKMEGLLRESNIVNGEFQDSYIVYMLETDI